MIYLVLKALHVVAVMTFVGGVLSNALILRIFRASAPGDMLRQRVIPVARAWDRLATTPAMAVVWAAGIALAIEGHWFGHPWLTVKIIAVIALSGIHGVHSGRLRRLELGTGDVAAHGATFSPFFVLGTAAVAIVSVVLKPGG